MDCSSASLGFCGMKLPVTMEDLSVHGDSEAKISNIQGL